MSLWAEIGFQQADRALFPQMAKIPENFLNKKMLEEVKNKTFISVHWQVNNNEKVDKKIFFLWQVFKKILNFQLTKAIVNNIPEHAKVRKKNKFRSRE